MEQLWEPDTLSSSVSYSQLIPVLVKSNQELHERIVDHDAQITDLEAANDAKQRRIDDLEERVNALVARMEAMESLSLFAHTTVVFFS